MKQTSSTSDNITAVRGTGHFLRIFLSLKIDSRRRCSSQFRCCTELPIRLSSAVRGSLSKIRSDSSSGRSCCRLRQQWKTEECEGSALHERKSNRIGHRESCADEVFDATVHNRQRTLSDSNANQVIRYWRETETRRAAPRRLEVSLRPFLSE